MLNCLLLPRQQCYISILQNATCTELNSQLQPTLLQASSPNEHFHRLQARCADRPWCKKPVTYRLLIANLELYRF